MRDRHARATAARAAAVAATVLAAAAPGLIGCPGGSASELPAAPIARRAPPPAARDPLDATALMADVNQLCAPELAGRGSYQPGGEAAADYMAAEMASAGLEVVRQPILGGIDNVIGIKRAGPEAVLVSAHYDHLGVDSAGRVYPGADDNASGAAVLLGLARAAARRAYRHTILFAAFGAEEAGLVGSGVYVADPTWPLARTLAVINFDMVGRNFFEWGSGRSGAAAIVGLEQRPDLLGVARRAARAAGLDLVPVPAALVELFGFEDRTDDWWFRRRGILSIHMSTSLHEDYHQPTDTPDRLSPAQLERVARTAAGLLDHLAARAPPRSVE
ncbi:MAG TPA: M28 family peptidase [Kofleriaceae bacterium]|nr:M28 family peptidase [Kofleriaceae bacterium]